MQVTSIKQLTLLAIIVIAIAPVSGGAVSIDTVPDSRYTTVQVGATQGQVNLLQSIVELDIPKSVQTIGEGITHLLKPYGYGLAPETPDNHEQTMLLVLPLPDPHRTLGPITLREALSVIGGESFGVAINPVTRTVSYYLRDAYRDQISEAAIEDAKEQWLAQQAQATTGSTDNPSPEKTPVRQYGPVKTGESLSRIAAELGFSGITPDQALVLLFQSNPHAFSSGNMNALRTGVMLAVPSTEDREIVPDCESHRLVNDHYRRWIARREAP